MVDAKEKEKEKPLAPWAIAGAVALFAFSVMYLLSKHGATEQIASKVGRLELVNEMRGSLAAVSEAQNGAVMAGTDKDAQAFVSQARAASTELDREFNELKKAETAYGDQNELNHLEQVSQAMQEFQRLDKQLLDLAVQNTNRKANNLALGPAAKLLQEMDAALSRIAVGQADSTSQNSLQILKLISDTRISALRIQLLLLPHIAEESEQKMDELEAQMASEDQTIRENLKSLRGLLPAEEKSDIAQAESRYDDFDKLRPEIIRLSRENTNVRSVAIAMSEKRKAMLAVQDALAALEHTVQGEEIVGR